ncbi:hypothetical protein C6P46_006927 [Rhodotorula mucilaginosa]|uniref:RRM domain-containing protein n=1 Tax=Rhodotorula mucilaginosa TaxID=5537 RepID=A0A9P6VXG1_RHOMI|nr:hypothetical protein C6P46_006927 [Rhodotorula mucilaginosa]
MTTTSPIASTSSSTSTTKAHVVRVSGLATTTTKDILEHFFSFCGKIAGIEGPSDGKADISFAKKRTDHDHYGDQESAAKTALLLSGGSLEGATIEVTSDDVEPPKVAQQAHAPASTAATATSSTEHEPLNQEDKPRSAIVAEILAEGYTLSDSVVQKAIEADKQYGISQRFLSFFNPLRERVGTQAAPTIQRAETKARELDEKHGLSLKAHAGWIIGEKYYFAALNSSIGQKVNSFYTTVAKEIQDIRDEAKRIAENKKSSLHAAHHDSDAIAASSVPTTGTATSTSLGTDAPLPSQGTYGEVDKNLNAPLESTAAPLK